MSHGSSGYDSRLRESDQLELAQDNRLETARLCAEAEKKLRPEEKNKLFKDLDFNKATFSKLAKIGSQPRLQTEAVKSLLPPNYTIVYDFRSRI